MSDYTVTTNFGAKDSLSSGDAAKLIKGSEFTTEFNNIATAVATKADAASPSFTGTLTLGTVTITVGSGAPGGAVTANVGSLFLRTDGGTNSTLYVKESGTGNTGWVAV